MTDDLVKRLRDMCGRDGILKCRDIYDTDVVAAADRIEKLEKALRWIAGVKSEIAEEPPEKVGEETHKIWISLILCAVSAETALGETK
jgi:hypothetical protein